MSDFIREFDAAEIRRIVAEAARRMKNHPPHRSKTVDWEKWEENERRGVAAEWATCEWLGVPEGPVFRDHGEGGDGGKDILLPDGRKVEVKSTKLYMGRLVFPKYQEFDMEFAVLVVKAWNRAVCAAGYATAEDWLEFSYMRDLGRGVGPQRVMDQKNLRPFDDLVREARAES